VSASDFDFWLGSWKVTWGDDAWGTNLIEKILDGRVVREDFDGRPGTTLRGVSLSVYDEEDGVWQQAWVDDQGGFLAFTGRLRGGVMELAGARRGEPVRMRWLEIGVDSLTWLWEREAAGKWETLWKLSYERLDPAELARLRANDKAIQRGGKT
jgi:hypothetical protein